MARYAVYRESDGKITNVMLIPEQYIGDFEVGLGRAVVEVGNDVSDISHIIVNGKAIVSHEPYNIEPLHVRQAQVWEQIKQRRYEAITSGVYVNSVDKWFHTDEVSVTSYATIAGMIALDNYAPVQWKTMDNTWLLLTVDLFKELQTAISQATNANYAVAEQHKAAMLLADNPLEYDYSQGWVGNTAE